MREQKHWIISFEGLRGLLYFLSIISLLSPSLVAAYLLNPTQFLSTPWPLSLLLAASVGGLVSLLACLDLAFGTKKLADLLDDDRPEKKDAFGRRMLVGGPVIAMAYQSLAIIFCLSKGWGFRNYVLTALGGTLLLTTLNMAKDAVWTWWKDWRQSRRQPSAE